MIGQTELFGDFSGFLDLVKGISQLISLSLLDFGLDSNLSIKVPEKFANVDGRGIKLWTCSRTRCFSVRNFGVKGSAHVLLLIGPAAVLRSGPFRSEGEIELGMVEAI